LNLAIARLPVTELEAGQRLYRIHRSHNGPWFFSGSGDGRFDPATPDRGACYLSTSELGAWVETFRTAMIIAECDVHARSLATVTLDTTYRCADLTRRQALAAGATGSMSSGADYRPSHALADDLQGTLDGVLWRVRHDLEQKLVGVALFGPEGEQNPNRWPPVKSDPIEPDLIRRAEDEFGYRVMPPHP
jgi:hypothetical protein